MDDYLQKAHVSYERQCFSVVAALDEGMAAAHCDTTILMNWLVSNLWRSLEGLANNIRGGEVSLFHILSGLRLVDATATRLKIGLF